MVVIDWAAVEARMQQQFSGQPVAMTAALDQAGAQLSNMFAMFGIDMDDEREVWCAAVGVVAVDSALAWSRLEPETIRRAGFISGMVVRSLHERAKYLGMTRSKGGT